MIEMEPMGSTVSDETLLILRRFYPPPDDTADKLLYEGDQYVRIHSRRCSEHLEERLGHIDVGGCDILSSSSETVQETHKKDHPMVISR